MDWEIFSLALFVAVVCSMFAEYVLGVSNNILLLFMLNLPIIMLIMFKVIDKVANLEDR